jgi:hypothetical protein
MHRSWDEVKERVLAAMLFRDCMDVSSWHFAELSKSVNGRFAPEPAVPEKSAFGPPSDMALIPAY